MSRLSVWEWLGYDDLNVGAGGPFFDFGRKGCKSPPVLVSGNCERGGGCYRVQREYLKKEAQNLDPALRRLSFSVQSKPVDKFMVLGEVLLSLRPFLYVIMIRRHGLRSWRPWLSALDVDASGMGILYAATLFPGQVFGDKSTSTSPPSKQEKNELRRRQVLWALYLMRSPFLERYTQGRLERVEKTLRLVPIFGSLGGKAVELIQGVQAFYTYTGGS